MQLEAKDVKDRVDELIRRAAAGEEVLISESGRPVAKLVSAEENPRLRALGMYKGQVWMSDDFAAPLTDEELKDWGL